MILTGKLAVGAALESQQREIFRLYIADALPPRRTEEMIERATLRGIPMETMTSSELRDLTRIDNHGGVAAEVGERTLQPFTDFVERLKTLSHPPMLFLLENFHDAHNFGYALRCLEALGADGILTTPQTWGQQEGIVSQSSSGAYDRMFISPLLDPKLQLRQLEERGIESVSTTAGAERSFYDFDLRAPVLIAVGGEFKGLSESVKKACRHSAHLPMTDAVPSFPAGHAAAILASEASRQRRREGTPGPLWPKKALGTVIPRQSSVKRRTK